MKYGRRNLIRIYRVERGLSLRELAALVGIGRMEMTKIDAGERLIDETLQTALATALGIDPQELDYAVEPSAIRATVASGDRAEGQAPGRSANAGGRKSK